jgi:hypothetical protein
VGSGGGKNEGKEEGNTWRERFQALTDSNNGRIGSVYVPLFSPFSVLPEIVKKKRRNINLESFYIILSN